MHRVTRAAAVGYIAGGSKTEKLTEYEYGFGPKQDVDTSLVDAIRYGYESEGRLVSIESLKGPEGGETVVSTVVRRYNAGGNLISSTQSWGLTRQVDVVYESVSCQFRTEQYQTTRLAGLICPKFSQVREDTGRLPHLTCPKG